MKRMHILAASFALLFAASAWAGGQTSAFTYQGHLLQNGTPTNGTHNLVFTLWDAASGGGQIGPTITQGNYPVANGVFDIDLDFGATAFNGQQRWLDVSVDGNALTPRQAVNASPVAVYAMSAAGGISATASISTNQFTNDHLYTGVSVSSQSPTMVMIAKPAFNPAGTSQVFGYSSAIDVISLTSGYHSATSVGPGGLTAGKPSQGDTRVLARIDPAYAGIATILFAGQHYNNLQIDVLATGATPYVAASYCYGNAFITDLQPMPQSGLFEMSILAVQIGVRIARLNSSGGVAGQVQSGWDFALDKSASAPCVN